MGSISMSSNLTSLSESKAGNMDFTFLKRHWVQHRDHRDIGELRLLGGLLLQVCRRGPTGQDDILHHLLDIGVLVEVDV